MPLFRSATEQAPGPGVAPGRVLTGLQPIQVRPGDVCDHRDCPAGATFALGTLDGELGFCSHHGRRALDAMILGGMVITGQRHVK